MLKLTYCPDVSSQGNIFVSKIGKVENIIDRPAS